MYLVFKKLSRIQRFKLIPFIFKTVSVPQSKIPIPVIADVYVVHSHLRMCAALKKLSFIPKKI